MKGKSKGSSKLYRKKISTKSKLEKLKESNFLTKKIFKRISENMHYEVFKFLYWRDLLQIRATTLGGYQLTSNKLLRSRIKNYHPPMRIKLVRLFDSQKINAMFEQTGNEILNFSYVYIREKEKISMFKVFLKEIPEIKGLNLDGTEINLKFIEENKTQLHKLEYLNLSNNLLKDSGLVDLSKALHLVPNLQILELEVNRIKKDGILALSKQFKILPKLQMLNLRNNELGIDGIKHLTEHFRFLTNLSTLNLRSNELGNEGVQILAIHLKQLPNLENLNLWNNEMSTGLQELAENFKFVPKLRDLNLYFNNIGEGGAKILIEHLKVLSHLEIIDLGSNYMKSVELQTIRDSFPRLTVTDQ